MSGAALALALALLVAPPPPRSRLATARPDPRLRGRAVLIFGTCAVAVAIAAVAPPTAVIALAAAAATAIRRRRARLRRMHRVREAAQLQAALEVLVGELRVGAHPVAAFDVAAGETDGPVSAGLRAVAARARLGADVVSGLRSVAVGSPLSAHWARVAACWELAQAHGLAIATLIGMAHRDIVERERFADQVGAGLSGARATAAVLAGLPLLGIGMGELIGAQPLRFLLSGGFGGWLLVVGVLLACAGLLWSDRLTAGVMA